MLFKNKIRLNEMMSKPFFNILSLLSCLNNIKIKNLAPIRSFNRIFRFSVCLLFFPSNLKNQLDTFFSLKEKVTPSSSIPSSNVLIFSCCIAELTVIILITSFIFIYDRTQGLAAFDRFFSISSSSAT